ncbi:MAG TPA: TonB-dependent receptor [Rhodanobacteraceae bacterium]|jgi:outer membrane receptor protein involved in Fe transport|nr:TonB-dependent receptor [Rhodanobacteraceae bacterium]
MQKSLAAVPLLLAVLAAPFVRATDEPLGESGAPPSESRNAKTKPKAAESEDETLATVSVVGKLDRARNQLSPDIGSSEYIFDRAAIEDLPLGDATPLNQLLLQAPGVVNDSYGQLHVRGDHADLQYRINGVIIPESISGFGQTLDTRIIDNLSFLTGALPAQYGYRTAGVVDITTKSATDAGNANSFGGDIGLVGGSFGTLNPSAELHGDSGPWSYFATASYLENDIGIENPTSSRDAIHDHTNQFKTFGDVSYLIDDSTRLSLMFGATNNRFEIPNNPGQTPLYSLEGVTSFDSRNLNARQQEQTRFATLSLQGILGATNYQVSMGQRYTSVDYQPDPIGDLIFTGVAGTIARSNRANTLQADFSTPAGTGHTVRYGLYVSDEHPTADNTSQVFRADEDGNQTSTTPITIIDDAPHIDARTYGLYLQDEWQISEKLTMNYGVRADQIDAYVNEGQLSPRLGLIYQLNDTTTLHAGYARYFTPPPAELIAPTDIALFQGTTNALPTNVNAETLPERSHYFDAGISQKIGGDLTLGLDAYYRKVTNLLDEGQFGSALIFSPFNYAHGKVRGVELTANYTQGDFVAYANVSSSRAEGKDVATGQYNFEQDELDYIATHWVHLDHDQRLASSGGVNYNWNGTRLGADYIYGSGLRADFANTAHLPQYYQINLSVGRKFDIGESRNVDVTLAAINVTDRVYLLRDGSGIGVGAPQYGPRRGLFLAIDMAF